MDGLTLSLISSLQYVYTCLISKMTAKINKHILCPIAAWQIVKNILAQAKISTGDFFQVLRHLRPLGKGRIFMKIIPLKQFPLKILFFK